ncbi:MAG: hypothetical protein VX589_07195 [Myxococcota bacterium]|nr:hypothetical protein [Myxococcota bacterium]
MILPNVKCALSVICSVGLILACGHEPQSPSVAIPPTPDVAPSCFAGQACPMNPCPGPDCELVMARGCNRDTDCPEGESCGGEPWLNTCIKACEVSRACLRRPRPCQDDTRCPDGLICQRKVCVNQCTTDLDCLNAHCMNGQCEAFPLQFSEVRPTPVGKPGQLYAGVATMPLDFPFGVSMAGFFARDGDSTPYNESLGGARRSLDRHEVRVLVLSTDETLLVILRQPLGWSTDYLRTLTALRLQALTTDDAHPQGINFLDNILAVSTHSHSHPGRFWNLAPELGLGNFGFGTFSPSLTKRYAHRFAETIFKALGAMAPARFGWSLQDDFDPEGLIHRDRRPQSPDLIDDRLLVWRVEDMDGKPIAGLVNLAVHGTMIETPMLTGDVPIAIETMLTRAASADAGRRVPMFFVNGNAGDAEPTGFGIVDEPVGRMQVIGARVSAIVMPLWRSIQTRPDIDLDFLTRRLSLTYERVGYDPDALEFSSAAGVIFRHGGLFCAGGLADNPTVEDRNIACSVAGDDQGYPMPNIHKSLISLLRIDDLLIAALPGEPTAGLGLGLADRLEADALNAGQTIRAMSFGYAQDYLLYLVEADDWFGGAHEANANFFGWKLGPHLVDETVRLAEKLWSGVPGVDADTPEPKPMFWTGLVDDEIVPTAGVRSAGGVADVTAATVRRGELVTVTWHGGHPGVDQPQIVLEYQNSAGQFETALRPSGLPFDNYGYESVLGYSGDYDGDHTWQLQWEFDFKLPLGTYRFVVSGQGVDGVVSTYEAVSAPVELRPAILVVQDAVWVNDRLAIQLSYPDAPSSDDGASPFNALIPRGTLLRHTVDRPVPTAAQEYAFILGPPVIGSNMTVRFDTAAGLVERVADAVETVSARTLTVSRKVDGLAVETVIDPWIVGQIEITDVGRPMGLIHVEDSWGNRVAFELSVQE